MRRATPLAAWLLALASSPALAWVPSRTDKGQPVSWAGSCAFLQPSTQSSQDMPLSTVLQVVTQSITNWQSVTLDAGCSYLKITQDAPAVLEAHYDHINTVKFRNDKWCRPAESNTPEACYSCAAAAITTVFYDDGGKIVDADVELNELDFTFVWLPSDVQPRTQTVMDNCYSPQHPVTSKADLENTLTHELGHFQGLDHTCWDHVNDQPCSSSSACVSGYQCSQRVTLPGPPMHLAWVACTPGQTCTCQPLDGSGQPVFDCADLSDSDTVPPQAAATIEAATMYNYASPGEIIKRSPEADDIAGICATYPKASDPSSCKRLDPTTGCGCHVGAAEGHAPLALGALLLVAALALLRRRRG
jgi:MYXO-CTERM domain-containing protein